MAHVITKPWGRQPVAAEPIDEYWFGRNLKYVFSRRAGWNRGVSGPAVLTAITGTKEIVSSGPSHSLGFGSTLGAGTTDSVELSFSSNSNQRSYIARAYMRGFGGGNLGRIFEKRVSGAQAELLFYRQTGACFELDMAFSTANSEWRFPANAIGTDRWFTIGVVRDVSSSSNEPSFYINGLKVTTTVQAAPSGTHTTNSDNYVLGNRKNDNARNWDGMISDFYLFDELLSDAEMCKLTANPWTLFTPRRIMAPVAVASSLPTLSNSTYVTGSLSSTGWRPQITAS